MPHFRKERRLCVVVMVVRQILSDELVDKHVFIRHCRRPLRLRDHMGKVTIGVTVSGRGVRSVAAMEWSELRERLSAKPDNSAPLLDARHSESGALLLNPKVCVTVWYVVSCALAVGG